MFDIKKTFSLNKPYNPKYSYAPFYFSNNLFELGRKIYECISVKGGGSC